MHRLEANSSDFTGIFQTAAIRISELREALPYGRSMIQNSGLQLRLLTANFDEARAFRRANPFDTTARKLPLIGHVKQPILEACRAEIGDEDFHGRRVGQARWHRRKAVVYERRPTKRTNQ